MGRKCSVYNCKSGYDSKRVTIYKFPEDEDQRRQWISCIPNTFAKVTKYMGVCALHWPSDTPLLINKKGGRHPVPTLPPSIFANVPDSCVPTHTSCTPRPTTKVLSSVRNPAYDELSLFQNNDRLKEDTFQSDFKDTFSSIGLVSLSDSLIVLQSASRTACVHAFSCYFDVQHNDNSTQCDTGYSEFCVSYEMYYHLKRIVHPSVKSVVEYWSGLEEVVRFLQHCTEIDTDAKFNFFTSNPAKV